MADAVYVVGTFPVTISGDSVIHPRARLDAKGGPVNIGRRCIVEERAVVGGGAAFSAASSNVPVPGSFPSPEGSVTLGDYVSVETGSVLEAGAVVGQGSVVGARSQIGSGAVIGRVSRLRSTFISDFVLTAVVLHTRPENSHLAWRTRP